MLLTGDVKPGLLEKVFRIAAFGNPNIKNFNDILGWLLVNTLIHKGDIGHTAIRRAIITKDNGMLADILSAKIVVSGPDKGLVKPACDLSSSGQMYLKLAALYSNAEAVRLLLDAKCIDPSDCYGGSLSQAVAVAAFDITKMLLADPRMEVEGTEDVYRAIHNAKMNCSKKSRELLLSDDRISRTVGGLMEYI